MKCIKLVLLAVCSICLIFVTQLASAETIKQTMDASMELEITYPNTVIPGREFSISIFIKNNGWEDKQEIRFTIINPDSSLKPVDNEQIAVDKIAAGGTYGILIDFKASDDISEGTHFLNFQYSQVLLSNNIEPLEPTFSNIAIPIKIREQPQVDIYTSTPESIFPNAEFPIDIEINSRDIDLKDVSVQIKAPPELDFRGETLHVFTSIKQNTPVSIYSQIITPTESITREYKIPVEIIVTYTNDIEEEKIDSQIVQLLLRPRTFMELTTDGGIWIGNFFVAPYVSIGTLIGIPAGTILSLMIRRRQDKKLKKKIK